MAEALDAEWFLVANKDKLSIKIRGQVTLGEDNRGLLTLESRKEDERWVTLSIDEHGALVVSSLAPNWQIESLGAWVSQTPGAVCIPGTLLSIGQNEVYISHNLQRGRVDQHLVLVPNSEVADDEPELVVPEADRILGVAFASDEKSEVEEAPEQLITTLPPGTPVEDVGFAKKVSPAADIGIPTLTEPVAVVREQGIAAGSRKQGIAQERKGLAENPRNQRKLPLVAVSLLGLVAIGGYFYWQSNQTTTAPVSAIVNPPPAAEPVARDQPAAGSTNDRTVGLVTEHLEVVADLEEPTAAEPVSLSIAKQDWSQEIAEARFLMNGGYINYPERNAVSILGEVLTASPGHAEAWQLLNEATAIYLTDAVKAYEDGFPDAAFNMIVEVERFHPNYPELDQIKSILGLN